MAGIVSVICPSQEEADRQGPFEAAEHTADWIASLAPDTLPEIEEPPASIASLLLGSLAEDEEPPVPITSIAPDPTDSDENS